MKVLAIVALLVAAALATETHQKRQVFVGAGYPAYGLSTYGYGLGVSSYGYGYPAATLAYGYPSVGYPAYSGIVYGRKKRSTDEQSRAKRQVFVGAGYPAYGLSTYGYGLGVSSYGYGYPAATLAYGYPSYGYPSYGYSGLVYGKNHRMRFIVLVALLFAVAFATETTRQKRQFIYSSGFGYPSYGLTYGGYTGLSYGLSYPSYSFASYPSYSLSYGYPSTIGYGYPYGGLVYGK